jgi:hypothetical protein
MKPSVYISQAPKEFFFLEMDATRFDGGVTGLLGSFGTTLEETRAALAVLKQSQADMLKVLRAFTQKVDVTDEDVAKLLHPSTGAGALASDGASSGAAAGSSTENDRYQGFSEEERERFEKFSDPDWEKFRALTADQKAAFHKKAKINKESEFDQVYTMATTPRAQGLSTVGTPSLRKTKT